MSTGLPIRRIPPDIRSRGQPVPLPPPGSASDIPLVRTIESPGLVRPAAAQDFNIEAYNLTLAAVLGATVTSATALKFPIPGNNVAFIQEFTLYVLSPTTLTSISWMLRKAEGPIGGWEARQNVPGVASFYKSTYRNMHLRVTTGAIDVLITNLNANGPWTVGARVSGWYCSLNDEARSYGNPI